ncbi:MAG: cytochrome c3 family protein [Gemmatimonadetes bacterium]|nr:cytochrome c3 family protein [Gemmatimonadota bacterium]
MAQVRARPGEFGIVAAALLVVSGAIVAVAQGPGVAQPIAFNHRKHTQDLQLDCELCHSYVRTGAHPGLPSLETCAMCHQATQGTTREAARVTELVAQGRPLTFEKLFRLPPHVFYTHRRHVGIGRLECRNCHGNIALTTRPPARPLVKIRMGFCLDCHRRSGQTRDCIACHR